MEPKDSLPHSQVPVTCPYPEPDRSIPCPKTSPPEDLSEYYYPIYDWAVLDASFPQVSLPNCIRFSSPPYALEAPPI